MKGRLPGWSWFATIMVLSFVVAMGQRTGSAPGLDFLRYARAGALVARGEGAKVYDASSVARSEVWNDPARFAERSFRYPPAVSVVFAPLGAGRPENTWSLWKLACGFLVMVSAFVALGVAALEFPEGLRPAVAFAAVAGPVIAFAPMYVANAREGQVNILVFALLVGAVVALVRGWDRGAGVLAAGAAAIKVAPVLLLLWFAWKRRWKAFLWGCGALAAISWLLPVAVFGPATAHGLLRQWAGQEQPLVTEVDERPGTSASVGAVNFESQSLRGILLRNFSRTPYIRLRDTPLEQDPGAPPPGLSVHGGRQWSAGLLRGIWLAGFLGLLVVAVFATAPRPGEDAEAAARRLPLEAALVLAAIPLVSPESRWIHLLLLAPALAALTTALVAEERRGPAWWIAAACGAAGALLLFLTADAVVGRETADALLARGAAGCAGILVFAASALTLFRERASVPVPPAVAV